MKRALTSMALIFGLAGLLLMTGCIPTEVATLERSVTFNVDEGAINLDIDTTNGQVTVDGVAGLTTVEITATLHSRGSTMTEAMQRVAQIELEIAQNGNSIVLLYDASAHPLNVRLYSGVDFLVRVPEEANANVNSSNGRIEIAGIAGELDLHTSNGRIGITDALADVSARTSNGRIDVARVEGILQLDTSNGEIDMENVFGVVDAETSNGSISFSGMLLAETDHRMETSNGAIDLAIRSDASLIIDASTSNGEIISTLPLIGDTAGNDWNAVLNPPATGTLTLRASNGRITMLGIL